MYLKIFAALLLMTTTVHSGFAQGASGVDSTVSPTLFKSRGDACAEDYAAELRSVGIHVAIRELDKLEALAKAAGLPKTITVTHVFFIGGLAIVNHVPPAAIVRVLRERPAASGVIGSSACATAQNHLEVHSTNMRVF